MQYFSVLFTFLHWVMTKEEEKLKKVQNLLESLLHELERAVDEHEVMMHHSTHFRLTDILSRARRIMKEICY